MAVGKYAKFISDRSGMEFPYKEMVIEWNGARVHISEYGNSCPDLSEINFAYFPEDKFAIKTPDNKL